MPPPGGIIPGALRDGLTDRPPRPAQVIMPDPDAAPDVVAPEQPPAGQLLADVALALAFLVLVAAVISLPALAVVEFAARGASASEMAAGAAVWAAGVCRLFLATRQAWRAGAQPRREWGRGYSGCAWRRG
jgi:hypothetical protein